MKLCLGVRALLLLCLVGVIAVYVRIAGDAPGELGDDPAGAHYNLLVDGFRHGQLNLYKPAPPELAQLTDPYDPTANARWRGTMFGRDRLHDLSYFRGKLYLYFGVTPAVLFFWPIAALTGKAISHQHATIFFCALGFLAGAGLVHALWRRYFAAAPAWVAAVALLAIGLASGAPLLLQRPEVWEVAIACGHAMVMLSLLALWRAWHAEPKGNEGGWLALASIFYGLAVGARPSLLPGAIVLVAPLLRARGSAGLPGGARWRLLVGAWGPIAVIGVLLLAYNYFRFGSVTEFGQHYQLAGDRQDSVRHFGVEHLGINFSLYFLSLARWSAEFPFFNLILFSDLPANHGVPEYSYGILTNTPFLLLAFAVPLAWRRQPENLRPTLRAFICALGVVFCTSALTMGFFYGSCLRYQFEFTPTLTLLAVCGWFGLHSTLRGAGSSSRVIHGLTVLALGYSIAFNLLYGFICRANLEATYGQTLLAENRDKEALATLTAAVRIGPRDPDTRFMLSAAHVRTGQPDAAFNQLDIALRLQPNPARAAWYLEVFSNQLAQATPPASVAHFERLVRLAPSSPLVHFYLGQVLAGQGRNDEARAHYEMASRLKRDAATRATSPPSTDSR